MSDISIDSILQRMRVLSAQAESGVIPPNEIDGGNDGEGGFATALTQAVNKVNDLQDASKQLKTSFETGDGKANLAEVMIASQKASLSFQAMVQVRNKLVEAYREIMNMQV